MNTEIEKKKWRKCNVILRKWLICCTICAKFHLGMVLTLCDVKLRRRQETSVSLLPSARKWRKSRKTNTFLFLRDEGILFQNRLFLHLLISYIWNMLGNLPKYKIFFRWIYFSYQESSRFCLFDSLKCEDVSSVNSVKLEFPLNSLNLKK